MKKVLKIVTLVMSIALIIIIFVLKSYFISKSEGDKKKEKELGNIEDSYESYWDFPYETMEFVDEEAFQFIQTAYEEVDFNAEFQQGNMEEYDYYKEKYRQLLNNEVTLFDRKNNEEVYLKDFTRDYYDQGLKNMDYSEYMFYFFDINEDGAPELCIDHQRGYFLYVFQYDMEKDKMSLWQSFSGGWRILMGSGIIDQGWSGGLYHRFEKYNEAGSKEVTVNFWGDDYWTGQVIYMVALPVYFDEQEKKIETKIPEEIKRQGYYDEGEEVYYFSVTEEQYKVLTDDFFKVWSEAIDSSKERTFTYEELFGQ